MSSGVPHLGRHAGWTAFIHFRSKMSPIKKAVYELVKLLEWRVADEWNPENNWLLEGRTVLIYKGGDRKDPANYRPITCLPTITKMVTLAIHEWLRRWLFGSVETSIIEGSKGA